MNFVAVGANDRVEQTAVSSVSSQTPVDEGLLLEFFLTFSRFEYALKVTGKFKRHQRSKNKIRRAEPDWDTFSRGLRDSFDANATPDLAQACEYLSDNPPNQQVIINESIGWQTPTKGEGEADVQFLLRMVRTVRNNLFHGGKHNIEMHEDTQRIELLLRDSLIVLYACLAVAPEQQAAFSDARL